MKNIHEEAFQLIYDDLTHWARYLNGARCVVRHIEELGINPLAKLDPKIPFYFLHAVADTEIDLQLSELIFLHDVSDLNLSTLAFRKLAEKEKELIKEWIDKDSEYTNNVVDLICNKKKFVLEKVRTVREKHYAISNHGQPGEVTQYRLGRARIISLD